MMGAITTDESVDEALARLRAAPRYGETDLVRDVSTDRAYDWPTSPIRGVGLQPDRSRHVVVIDSGVKYNIMRLLAERGCRVTALPPDAHAEQIRRCPGRRPPGPGDPAFMEYQVETVRSLIGKAPILGICLGHQVLGRAFGARTFKLKFGHRGANHPVKDLATGRVHITAQNHGYAVDSDGMSADLEVAQLHLNDGTCEGLRHRTEPVISIQYHSEASPGPLDNVYVFDRFVTMMEEFAPNRKRKGGAHA